jgi:integrase
MSSLHKITYVYWLDAEGRRVTKDTPGARKHVEQSAKWYACWKEGDRQVRVPLCTDKGAAKVMLGDLLRKRERGEAGMVDEFKEHKTRAITDHLKDYLGSVRGSGKVSSEKYFDEKQRILKAVFAACGVKTLADLTSERLDKYLDGLTCSAGTKRVHHTAINAFAVWLVQKKRIAANPLATVARPVGGKVVRKRRALKPDELQRLLDAARERPLADASHNRGGRPKKGRRNAKKRVAHKAKLSEQEVARLTRLGRERALLYKAAVYTGLRKGELAALRVCHLNLDRKPYPSLELPGEFTKNDDDARLLLVPALAEELRNWVAECGKGPNDLVFAVPEKMTPIMKRDLARAVVLYKDDRDRYADFHALRKSAGTMLGVAGVPVRIRQLFMRHGDIRLTMQTYDDSDFAALEEAVRALEKLNLR